jgi:Flp pilus assembly protein TadD
MHDRCLPELRAGWSGASGPTDARVRESDARTDAAHELTHGENPDILRALARLRLARGDKAAARKLLEHALRYAAPSDRASVEEELAALG